MCWESRWPRHRKLTSISAVAAGIPIFGLDGLTSAAYGPEAAMTLLIALGFAGVQHWLLPVFGAILTLLVIVYFSYRQTIVAYPSGGGSFTVASENLGDGAGLLAAAALMIDYILTAAVGISAGVTALVSAVPSLHPHQLSLCILILLIIALVNMRGMKESGFAFMLPTFLFVGTLVITILVGVMHAVAANGHPGRPRRTAAGHSRHHAIHDPLAAHEDLRQRMCGHDRC